MILGSLFFERYDEALIRHTVPIVVPPDLDGVGRAAVCCNPEPQACYFRFDWYRVAADHTLSIR